MLLVEATRQQKPRLDPCFDVHNAPTAADHGGVRRKSNNCLKNSNFSTQVPALASIDGSRGRDVSLRLTGPLTVS